MSQEVQTDSVSEQDDEGESSPEPQFAEGININYPSNQLEKVAMHGHLWCDHFWII